MKIKGAILQKSKPPPIIVAILLSIENIDSEKMMMPAKSKITGIKCEMSERFAWNLTSLSSVTK